MTDLDWTAILADFPFLLLENLQGYLIQAIPFLLMRWCITMLSFHEPCSARYEAV